MNKAIKKAEKESTDFINQNNRFIETGDPFVKYIAPHDGLASFGRPNTTVNIRKEKTADSLMYPNALVFEATYNFDDQGRRKTSKVDGNKDSVALFFGDAHCFGEGLNDNETLPYFFEERYTNYTSYNYGFLGHGPNHMLYRINTKKFKEEFKDCKGKVFFIYRDDAVKVSVGEVPWGEGYPKYILEDNNVIYKGSYGGNTYKPNNMYLPSMFTENDLNITTGILKECESKLKEISDLLELHVVIIPLSFSNYEIQPLLEDNGINVINLYTTDLEFHTNANARFLDGVHTKYSNKLIVSLIDKHIKKLLTNSNNGYDEYRTLEDLEKRLQLEAMYIPCMVDFPYDDAGVIISNVLKRYKGISVEYNYLLNYLKNKHTEKLNKLQNVTN